MAISKNIKLITLFSILFLALLMPTSKNIYAATTNLLVENEYLQYALNRSGNFTIGTSGGNELSTLDNYKLLLYGHPSPSTSYTTIHIDGITNHFSSDAMPIVNYANLTSTAIQTKDNIKITQELSIVKNENTNKEDIVQIKYIVTNNDIQAHQYGMRIMMDTMLGNNDAAPFRIPGVGAVTTEREFSGDSIPQYWQAFDNLNNPTVISHGTFYNSGMLNKPDKVQFTNWNRVYYAAWDYQVQSSSSNGDSAVSIIWNSNVIEPGETKEFITYYGISDFEQDLRPPLTLSVTGASAVQSGDHGYSPNPFTITAYVSNIGTAMARNVNLSLELPEGLTILPGQEANGVIGDIGINGEKQVSWDVRIEEDLEYARSLNYTVNLSSSNAESKSLSRTVIIPPITPLDHISLSPNELDLLPGESEQLSVIATMKDGSTEDVTEKGTTYSSSNPQLVTVGLNGEILVKRNSIVNDNTEVYIRAYYNGKMDTSTIKIKKEKSLVEIKSDPLPQGIEQGNSYQITGIKAIWSDGSESEVSLEEVLFESSAPTKISVSPSGILEVAHGATGSTYIYVRHQGKTLRTLVTIKVPPILESIELSNAIPQSLEQGGSHQISSVLANWSNNTQTPVTSGITYESSAPEKITVSSTGLIEAVPGTTGSAYIYVRYGGKTLRTLVTLATPPTLESIELSGAIPVMLLQGGNHQILSVLANWSNKTQTPVTSGVTYESSAPDKITVSSTGLIEAVPGATGSAYIYVRYEGKSIRTLVALATLPTLESIALSEAIPVTLAQGGNYQISSVLANWSNNTQTSTTSGITYESSAPDKITVSSTGLIEAVPGATGSAYIYVRYEGKSIRTLIALATLPTLESIALSEAIPVTLLQGGSHQISSVLANWSNNTQTSMTSGITYESSAPDKITVSSTGLIEAVPGATGSAYIYVRYEGRTIRALVNLSPPTSIASIQMITPLPTSLSYGDSHQISDIIVNWSDGIQTTVTTGITYQSSATSKITVSSTGVLEVVPGATGSSYIYVRYGGKTHRSLVVINN